MSEIRYYCDPQGDYLGAFDAPPEGAVEVPEAPADARQTWDGEAWSPVPEPVPVIDAIDLWSRATNEEAEAIEGYMAQAPARVRNIFRVANTFRGDHELFGMLKDAAETLFSPERAAALLAPSRYE